MAEEKTVEIATNCLNCKKPLRKATKYYRNGQYYCNKNCWKAKSKAPEEAKKG
ncbi:MAG: hypothetical protein ABIJ41_05790 [Candidatus Omnitrophota bacterium]